jgi:hypothetical protein
LRRFTGALALAILCSCTQHQSRLAAVPVESAGWTFRPPPSWRAVGKQVTIFGLPSVRGVRQWRSRSRAQSISFHVTPVKGSVELRARLDPYLTQYSTLAVCRGLHALYGRWRPPFGLVVSDDVAMERPGSIAVATYFFPRSATPDPDAEKSIRTLCPVVS